MIDHHFYPFYIKSMTSSKICLKTQTHLSKSDKTLNCLRIRQGSYV